MATQVADDVVGSDQPKAAILLIVGEPFSDASKQQILDEVAKGLKRWDSQATGVDLEPELTQMAASADLGEERRHGERVIQYGGDTAVVEVLINAQGQTLKDSLKTLLTLPCPAKAVIYAGYAFHGSAAWVMQDDLFTSSMFSQVFKDPNVENAIKKTPGASLLLSTVRGSDWATALKGSEVHRLLNLTINPGSKAESGGGVGQFSAYISSLVRVTALTSMLASSDVIGNISFSRPVLYIFPGFQGDAALFGMKGFNMLVDAGYSRRPCFWDFVRHLDGIDALLMTHLGPDNLFGLKALLERKFESSVHPDIDYMYMNAAKTSNGIKAGEGDTSELVINLAAEGSALVDFSRKMGHAPHPLTRPLSSNLEPVNLYHKVGKGSLDMYVLNPVGDAKETKEFLAQWGKQAPSFSQSNGIPIPNCSSICALLVVRPASSMEKITRILFPGTAPQHKLLEGLERVKHLEFLKHPTFCTHDQIKAKKAAMANGRASSSTRRPTSMTMSRTTRAEPPRHLDTRSPGSRTTLPSPASGRTSKNQKESSNKRVSGVTKEKGKAKRDEKEKEDKSKSSSASTPSKASVKTISPMKSPSPTKTSATSSPEERPRTGSKSQPAAAKPAGVDKSAPVDTPAVKPADIVVAVPATEEPKPTTDNRFAASPEELPEPDHFGSNVDVGLQQPHHPEQAKLRELGIYDNEDDDEGVDNRYDEKENGGMFGASEEEVQPQALPEPVAVLETPTTPDMMPEAFCKPSLMEQSQLFEDGIEPDYGAEGQVSITDSCVDSEKAAADTVSEPQEAQSSLLTGSEAFSADQPQIEGSSVSDYPPVDPSEDKVMEPPMTEPLAEQAAEPSLMMEPMAEKAEEPSLMSQSMLMAEPLAEKIDEPSLAPEPSLVAEESYPAEAGVSDFIPESMDDDSLVPVKPEVDDFAPHRSFPGEPDLMRQEEPREELPATTLEDAPPLSLPEQHENLGPESSEFPEEPKEPARPSDSFEDVRNIAPASTDFQEFEKESALAQDDKGEDDRADSPDAEEHMAQDAAGFDAFKEQSPANGEVQMTDSKPELAHPDQESDDDREEVEENFAPSCQGSLQASGLEQQPEISNNLHDDFGPEVQGDSNIPFRDPSPALEEPDVVKESQFTQEEPSFEDSLKEESPAVDGPDFDDGLKESSPPLHQQEEQEAVCAAPAALEPNIVDNLRETSPALEEPGFDLNKRDASPVLDEQSFDMKEKEDSPVMEETGFDEKDREVSPMLEKQGFESQEKEMNAEPQGFEMEASPAPEEAARDDGPAAEERGFDSREASPAYEEPERKEKEASPVSEDDVELKEKEASPVSEDDVELKEKEASPESEDDEELIEKEASPAMEEMGYSEQKDTEPLHQEPSLLAKDREASPFTEDAKDDDKPRELAATLAADLGSADRGQESEEEDFAGKLDPLQGSGSSTQEPDQYDFIKKQELDSDGEEEKDAAVEKDEVVKREDVPVLEAGMGLKQEEEDEVAVDRAQADAMARQTLHDMDASDDEGQDDDEETAEAVDSGDNDSDDFVYEKEVSVGEKEVLMAGTAAVTAMELQTGATLELTQKKKEDIMDLEGKAEQQMFDTPAGDSQIPSHRLPEDEEREEMGGKDTAAMGDQPPPQESFGMEAHVPQDSYAMAGDRLNESYGSEGDSRPGESFGMEGGKLNESYGSEGERMGESFGTEGGRLNESYGSEGDRPVESLGMEGGRLNESYGSEGDRPVESLGMEGGRLNESYGAEGDRLGESYGTEGDRLGESYGSEGDRMQDSCSTEGDRMQDSDGTEGDRRLDESYGMEGGLTGEDRDMQEIMTVEQVHKQADLAQEEDSDLDSSQEPDSREEQAMNPFIGLEEQAQAGDAFPKAPASPPGAYQDDRDQRAAAPEFDPLSQWGPPTGLPAPAYPQHDESDDEQVTYTECEGQNGGISGQHPHDDDDDDDDDDDLAVMGSQERLAKGEPASLGGHMLLEKGECHDMPATDKSSEADAAEFDPLSEWGQPMGLPAPTPPDSSNKTRKAAGDAKKSEASKKPTAASSAKSKTAGADKRPASATKPSPRAMNGTADTPKSANSKPEAKRGSPGDTPRTTRPTSSRSADTSRHNSKSRSTPTTPRRPASSRSRVSPEVVKMPPLPPFTPFFVDLTYIPNHGDLNYVDGEFFKRVRARYYVLSARNPNPKLLEMLMEAKEGWDKANEHQVTVIPTYETQLLQHWMAVHQEKLAECKIDIAPAASRCTVRLQDHEDSCYTYRLEF